MKGYIYKIVSPYTKKVYIGSTNACCIQSRYNRHVQDYVAYLNERTTNYLTSFEILKYPEHKVVLVEEMEVENAEELKRKEGIHQKYTSHVVNKRIECRTRKEYYADNILRITELKSRPIECECGCTVRADHLARHRKTKVHQDFIVNQEE